MGDRDDLPYIVIERHSSGAGPFFWGALFGAAAALLLAPRSGAETQREIRDSVRRLRDSAEDRVDDAREALLSTIDRARDEVSDRIDAVRGAVHTRTEHARDAVEAGRRAARDARSNLEERLEDAKRSARGETQAHAADADVEVDVIITDVVIEESDRPDLG
jgi:gas vesicle protein